MMSVVGITDFNLKDLIKPEPDRVALILSGLVNFGKFREMQLVNFDQLTEKTVGHRNKTGRAGGGCELESQATACGREGGGGTFSVSPASLLYWTSMCPVLTCIFCDGCTDRINWPSARRCWSRRPRSSRKSWSWPSTSSHRPPRAFRPLPALGR